MVAPLVTPLALASTYVQFKNQNSGTQMGMDDNSRDNIHTAILWASNFITRECGLRRFDEWYETRPYTCLHERIGGDLLDTWTLQLDTDCRSLISITNGEGSNIPLVNVKLLSTARDVGGVKAGHRVRINQFSGLFWFSAGHDPYNALQIEARWGYGGQWVNSGTTLNHVVASSDTTIQVSTPSTLETGMVIKIVTAAGDIEYLYIDSSIFPSANPIPVGRGFNDSTPLNFVGAEQIFYWQADLSVEQLVCRLASFYREQIKSPVFGQAVIGDYSFPVSIDGLPKDVIRAVRDLALVRSAGGVGV